MNENLLHQILEWAGYGEEDDDPENENENDQDRRANE